MAYIVVQLTGEKKRGGFLKIDGGNEIELFDATTLKITEGTHHLEYSSQSSIAKAGIDLFSIFTNGATQGIGASKDYDMTLSFEKNTVMLMKIASDFLGRISGAPDCQMTVVSDEKMRELDQMYQEDQKDRSRRRR